MALLFTTSGSGLSANITAVASLSQQVAVKMELLVDTLKTGSGFNGPDFFTIDSDGAGTNKKIWGFGICDNSGNFTLTTNTGNGNTTSTSTAQSILPSVGSLVRLYFCYDNTNGQIVVNLYDVNGTSLVNQVRTGFFGGALTTTGANGRFTLNGSQGGSTRAVQYGGVAVYSAPLVGGAQFSAPASGDANIVAMWKLNDAFSGTSPSTAAATVGAQGLVLTTSQYSYATQSSWFPPPAAPPPKAVNNRATFAARHRSFYY